MKKALSTAGERFALAAARLETGSVVAGRDSAQDWAPRHGSLATPGSALRPRALPSLSLRALTPTCAHSAPVRTSAGLVCAVQSASAGERKVGVWTLAALPFKGSDPRVVAVIKALTRDPDLDVRRAAVENAQFQAELGDVHVLAALADRLLADEDFSVRWAAAEGIRKLVFDRHVHLGGACRILEPRLADVFDVILRCWAPRRRDGRSEADTNIEKIRFSADDLVASVRTVGVQISEKETRGIFALAPATKDKLLMCHDVTKVVADTAAQDRLPEFVVEALIWALMDPNTSVRSESLRTIKHITDPGDARATRRLIEQVEKGLGGLNTELLDALTALAKPGDLRVTIALSTASEDPRPTIRRMALECLAQHVDVTDASSREMASHAAAARSMREEPDTGVRKAALRLLSCLNEPSGDKAKGGGGAARSGGVRGGRGTWIAESRRNTIEERLQSADSQLRYMAAREAGLMAETSEAPERRAVLLEMVIERLRVDEDAAVRRAAIEATAKLVQRSLKDAQVGGSAMTVTSTSSPPKRGAAGGVAAPEEIVGMVIKVLLERVRKEPVELTRLTCVEMMHQLAQPGDILVLSVLADRVCSDDSVQIRKSMLLALGHLMGRSDGSVDLEAAEQLGLHHILLQRSICVEEAVVTRNLAKALLHRIEIATPPKSAASDD